MKRIKLKFNDEVVEADSVDVTSAGETWSQFLLEDGTVLRLKPVLKKNCRLVDKYEPNGNPIYSFDWQMISDIESPEELRRI